MAPAWPPLVVVVVFCWFVFCVFEFELLEFTPLEVVPPLNALDPPLTLFAPVNPTGLPPVPLAAVTTGMQAGNPAVPIPGSVPAGQFMVELDVVFRPAAPDAIPAVLLAVAPFTPATRLWEWQPW
jgi:hypothetical protein